MRQQDLRTLSLSKGDFDKLNHPNAGNLHKLKQTKWVEVAATIVLTDYQGVPTRYAFANNSHYVGGVK